VALDPAQYDGLAIEGELGLRLAQDIPDLECLRSHRREVIAAGFAVIELHNYVFRNSPHTAQELIGNNGIHAGVVLPLEETEIRNPDELLDPPLSVWKNGERLGTKTGRALQGGPFGSVMRLAELLERFGRTLRRGQLVLTGSPLPFVSRDGGRPHRGPLRQTGRERYGHCRADSRQITAATRRGSLAIAAATLLEKRVHWKPYRVS
jgi:2-keto-4-pentenoate hydratase